MLHITALIITIRVILQNIVYHKEDQLLSKEIDMLLKKGATVESKHEEGEFISLISLVRKPKYSYRIKLNLKKLNENVP